ncbi:MAG: GDSL-type esterase/lipase family protein [Bacteroidota bacterium]|nr:GDSL-type esterase/lipase family protein [Bacteroidota bacterium]
MLGNSLIRHGKWDSLLSRKDVINRGISGDRLKCICERLSYLDGYNPKICFIEGGINDLPGSNPDSLFEDYKQIVSYFKKRKIIPIINLVLFINPRAGLKWDIRKNYISINKQVAYLDERLIVYSSSEHITYIDLNKKLCHDNVLMDKYTTDGVHLTSEGYRIWSDEIKNILKKYNIRR